MIRAVKRTGGSVAKLSADTERTFDMLAYTGAEIVRAWGTMIVDLSGIVREPRTAMLFQHDDLSPVGVATKHQTGSEGLRLSGYMVGTKAAALVCDAADQGFPWKASIGIRFLETEQLPAGRRVEVNGRTVEGPMTIVRRAHLFETSFITCSPADWDTKATVFRSDERVALKGIRIFGEDRLVEAAARDARARFGPAATPDRIEESARAIFERGDAVVLEMLGARPAPSAPAPPSAPQPSIFERRLTWLNAAVMLVRPFVNRKGLGCSRLAVEVAELEGDEIGFTTFEADRALVTLSPKIESTERAVLVLLHETLHACLGPEAAHGPRFGRACKEIGLSEDGHSFALEGQALADVIREQLGPYPGSVR